MRSPVGVRKSAKTGGRKKNDFLFDSPTRLKAKATQAKNSPGTRRGRRPAAKRPTDGTSDYSGRYSTRKGPISPIASPISGRRKRGAIVKPNFGGITPYGGYHVQAKVPPQLFMPRLTDSKDLKRGNYTSREGSQKSNRQMMRSSISRNR